MRVFLLGVLAIALCCGGCGGSSPARDVRLGDGHDRAPRHTLVAALGDSITAGSPAWDPDARVRGAIGAGLDPESQFEYWAQLRMPKIRFRNCGVFGERTDQIAARLDRCARGAQVLIVQGGINDIAQGRSVATAAKNLDGIVRAGRAARLRVKLVEVLPWNTGYPDADPAIRKLNRQIHAIGRARDVPVLPWYRALEDPARPGRMRSALTADGSHPSVAGYRRLARTIRLP